MQSYFVKIEARFTVVRELTDDDGELISERECIIKVFYSKKFDSQKDAIDFGNKFITDNLWLEQYPGYVGQRLNNRFGTPLVGYILKNGAQVFISVIKHNTPECITSALDFLRETK